MAKNGMKWIMPTAEVLAGVGALNWGLVQVNGGWNIVQNIANFTGLPIIRDITYIAVGVSGVIILSEKFGITKWLKKTFK